MDINVKTLIFQIVNFGILTAVLTYFLYQPILTIFKQRQKKINEGLKAAEQSIKEKEEVEKKKKEILTKARKEALAIIEEAKQEAAKQKAELLKQAKVEAKKEADKILAKAQEEIKAQEKAFQEKLGEIIIKTTQQLLSETLTAEQRKAITKKMLAQLSK